MDSTTNRAQEWSSCREPLRHVIKRSRKKRKRHRISTEYQPESQETIHTLFLVPARRMRYVVRMSSLASPELRYNPITLDWVIMAAARGRRPDDFHKQAPEPRPIQAPHNDDCPFCPGNEKLTDREITREASPDGAWAVRVLPNKFAAFAPTHEMKRSSHDSFRSMAATDDPRYAHLRASWPPPDARVPLVSRPLGPAPD